MKLSVKIREEEKQHKNPLVKAKIPISVMGIPFLSGFTAGDPSDLSFNLSTNFSTGPSLKLSYNPTSTSTSTTTTTLTPPPPPTTTNTTSPFCVTLKSGVGLFGSPHNSPLTISAHFNLFSNLTPTFSLQIKPQFGDFSLHKATFSNPESKSVNGSGSSNGFGSNNVYGNGFVPDRSTEWSELSLESCGEKNGFPNPNCEENGGFGSSSGSGVGIGMVRPLGLSVGAKDGIFSGVAVRARTALPVMSRLVVNFRWGVHVPRDIGRNLPYLTIDKIGIERVEEVKAVKSKNKSIESNVGDVELLKGMCFWMRRDLEVLHKENVEMKQSLEDMRLRVPARNYSGESDAIGKKGLPSAIENSGNFEQWRSKKSGGEVNGQRAVKKSVNSVSDVESELQKAIKAASS